MPYPDFLSGISVFVPYVAFLIAVFSALRLAKFNVDERQTSSFVGLPTPAMLFLGSHSLQANTAISLPSYACILPNHNDSAVLLVNDSGNPMFSLKFKTYHGKTIKSVLYS
jgi:CDP-diacylglycerol--serine O-phosphatidyltransferase